MFDKLLRKLSDSRWLEVKKNVEALEEMMTTVEARMESSPRSITKEYLEVVEILLAHNFSLEAVPIFRRTSAVLFRAARMFCLVPSVDNTSLANKIKKTVVSSFLSLLQHTDSSLLSIIIDDAAHLLKNLVVLSELQASNTRDANGWGSPRIRAFRGLALYSSEGENWTVEVDLLSPVHLMRCQNATIGLISQLLRLLEQSCIMLSLQERSLTLLWQVLCTQIMAPTTHNTVRVAAMKLLSNQLLIKQPATPSCHRCAFSSLLHLTEHRNLASLSSVAGGAGGSVDIGLASEVHTCLRRLVPLLDERSVKQCLPALLVVVTSLRAQQHWSSLQGTLVWCVSVCIAAVPESGTRGCDAVAHLWRDHGFSSEVSGCHAVALAGRQDLARGLLKAFEAPRPSSKRPLDDDHDDYDDDTYQRSLLGQFSSSLRGPLASKDPGSCAPLCTALRLFALSCEMASPPPRQPCEVGDNDASLAGLLFGKFHESAAYQLDKGVLLDTAEVSSIVDTALVLVLHLPRNGALASKLRSAVRLAVEFLSRHARVHQQLVAGDSAAVLGGYSGGVSVIKDPALVLSSPGCNSSHESSGEGEDPLPNPIRVWNLSSQVLARPLWERCLQLVCVSPDSLLGAPGETKESVLHSFVGIASEAEPSTQVKMMAQFPVLLTTLVRGDASSASSALLKRAHRWLFSVLHKTSPTTGDNAVGLCAAHSLGVIAREFCNPATWVLQPGVCPRQMLSCWGTPAPPGLVLLGDTQRATGRYRRAAWDLFEATWQGVGRSDSLSEDIRGELVRSFAAVLRFGSRSVLQQRAVNLTALAEEHWQLLLQGSCSDIVRTVLATEAHVLFACGTKVLTLMENGALPSTTQQSPSKSFAASRPPLIFTSAVQLLPGYLKALEDSVSKRSGGSSGGSGGDSNALKCSEVVQVQVFSLGSLMHGLDLQHEGSDALLLWVTLRLVSVWSNRPGSRAALEAYRELVRLPDACVVHLKRVLLHEESSHDKVILLIGLLRRRWVTPFVTTVLERGLSTDHSASKNFLKAVIPWLVPELVSGRETEAIDALATLVRDQDVADDDDGSSSSDPSTSAQCSSSSSSRLGRRSTSEGSFAPKPSVAVGEKQSVNASTASSIVSPAALASLGKMLHHKDGLMERILVHLLMADFSLDSAPNGSMTSHELELRGEYLLQLLPEQSTFEALIKGWDKSTFHWRVVWELSGQHPLSARRALRAVAALQGQGGVSSLGGGGGDDGGGGGGDGGGGGGGGVDVGATPEQSKKSSKKHRGRVAVSSARVETPPSHHRQQAYGVDTVTVECWVQKHFLGVVWQAMSNFQDQTPAVQERRLLTLAEMLKSLPSARFSRFVPKVMAILLPNLGDETSSAITATSSKILVEFVSMFNDSTAREHLSTIVVAVLPLLERCSTAATSAVLAPVDVANLKLAETSAVRLLRLLILDRADALQSRFHCIPFCIRSNLPELEPVQQALASAHGDPSLAEELEHLIALMMHDSMSIKRTTLNRLNEVLILRRSDVLQLVSANDEDATIPRLLKELFVICAQNTDKEAKLATAECLGSLGAIDPASLQLTAGSTGVDTGQAFNNTEDIPMPPWTVSKKDFAILLVSDHLASALRESTSMQGQETLSVSDRIAFAIQQLLKTVRAELSLGPTAAMPESLEAQFGSNLELIRPLWASSYLLEEVREPREPPFLKRGLTFTRWAAQLCRYLIKKSKGPFKEIFQACSGAVKTCTKVAQFLLPYLVLDSLSHGHEPTNEVILEEFLIALRGGEEDTDSPQQALPTASAATKSAIAIEPVVIQAVFTLVETLEHWLAVGATPRRKSRSRGRGAAASAAPSSPEPEVSPWTMMLEDIDRFLQGVPLAGLARAAFGVRAYTRSLRYLEAIVHCNGGQLGAKQQRRYSAQQESSLCTITVKLPPASSTDIDKLSKVYSSLDEPDGMSGLGALRHAIAEEPDTLQRIRAMEHAEQWTGVLQEYESALQDPAGPSVLANRSLAKKGAGAEQGSEDGGGGGGEGGGGDCCDDEYNGDEEDDEFQNWDEDETTAGVLEHGMLRSLLVLGHLESVLNQYVGLSMSKPQLRPLLSPVAVAAAWRLQRWDVLSTCLGHCEDAAEGEFEVDLAKTLSAMAMCRGQQQEEGGSAMAEFKGAVQEARQTVMDGLAAASRESYQRAYPLLFRLHLLSECEAGAELLRATPGERPGLLARQDWNGRLALLSPSLPLRAPLIAVRRVIFSMASLPEMAVSDLLSYSKLARVGGNFPLAKSSWRQAKSLASSPDSLIIQEAKILHAQGYTHRALQVIEPSESELTMVRQYLEDLSLEVSARVGADGGRSGGGSGRGGRSRQQDHQSGAAASTIHRIGKRLLYSTDWQVETGRTHGDPVLEMYELARQARPDWARAYFSTAKYYDLLLARRRETAALEKDPQIHELAKSAVHFYADSLRFGSKFTFQSMPRLLTLWFEFSLLDDSSSSSSSIRMVRQSSSASGRNAKAAAASKPLSALAQLQSNLNEIIRSAIQTIPPHMWYTSIQQLISRVGHPDPAVVALLHAVLIKIASAHSRESVWSIAPLFASNNDVRRKAGQVIMKSTAQALSRAGLEEESVAFAGAKHLFSDLIKNAEFQTDEKKTALKMTRNIILSDYVVPNCKTLTPVLQPKAVVSREGAGHDPFPRSTTRIAKFHETMTVMHSKAKPKKVSLDTTAGETVSYLCKREKNGDLRKDARLMEFNAVVNRMLQRDVAGRHRRLRLRTYAVICLNEECGLLEWVPNTVPMRTLIADAYAVHPAIPNPRFTAPSVRDAFCSMQQQRVSQHAMGESFRDDFFGQFTPCFHRWFLKSFPEPTAWFEARTAYTRSVAVWSAVGHVVGLGDRHLENILIDVRCGECVHVDFDCLFDKGITLARPEVVPFRLTSHLVEAFGVTGYEGIFRRVMECTFSVLRENQETLVSVLEPFLQDPTMGWDRQGRAQRKDDDAERRPAPHDATIDPKRVLSTVRGRLRGVFNLRDSHAWSSRAVKPIPPMGISDSNLAFSVQGQVDRLIQEATSDENLCLMYVGWMPWL